MSVKLVKIIDFKEQNEAVTLGEGIWVVGRGEDAAVTLNDKRCSRKQAILHLKIVKQQIEFTITPTGTNPCYVYKNKTKKPIKLTKDEKYKLLDKDVICFLVLEHQYLCKFENPRNNEEKKVKKKSEKMEISDEDENIKEDEEENEKSDGDEELLDLEGSEEEEEEKKEIKLPPCKYGAKCYQKNSQHLKSVIYIFLKFIV